MKGSALRTALYLATTLRIHKRQNILTPEGFEPTIPARERPHTNALDCSATGTGTATGTYGNILSFCRNSIIIYGSKYSASASKLRLLVPISQDFVYTTKLK